MMARRETYSDQAVLAALRRHANPDGTLTHEQYDQRHDEGEPASVRVEQRFGWNLALLLAGLVPRQIHRKDRADRIPEKVGVEALQAASVLSGDDPLTYVRYDHLARRYDLPSGQTIRNRLGPTWNAAKARAGIA